MQVRSLLILTCLTVLSLATMGQSAPGGVEGSSVWYDVEDNSSTIANHQSFNLLAFESYLRSNPSLYQETSTYFFVLEPTFSTQSGVHFMTLGGVEIYDDHIECNGSSKPIQFVPNEPTIITVSTATKSSFGRRTSNFTAIHDSTLFSMAEVLLFPDYLTRWEIHKVNSYLALKYSINITQNTNPQLRFYHKADSTLYWSSVIDRFFDQRVVGIGNSADERFYQTQSTVSQGDFMLVALDTVKPIATMPAVSVSEDAFIVFSERSPQAIGSLACALDQSVQNPLRNWKFVLYDWDSPAEKLKVRYQRPKGQLADSLFLWDGNQHWHLPVTYLDSVTVEYTIYFDMLQNGMHYFFVQKFDLDCPNLNTEIDPLTGMLKVKVDDQIASNWILETSSLKTGVTTSQEIIGSVGTRQLEEGQYLIKVTNTSGLEYGMRVVNVNSDVDQSSLPNFSVPSIKLYPNPVQANQKALVELNRFPSEQDVELVISDAFGRVIYQQTSAYEDMLRIPINFPMVGSYQVSIRQGEVLYSLKAIVLQ